MVTVLLWLVVILNLSLGFLVFWQNPRRGINQYFSLATLFLVAWIVSNYLSNLPFNYLLGLLFNRLIFTFTTLFAWAIFYFTCIFPKNLGKRTKLIKWFTLIPTIIVAGLSFTPAIVKDITVQSGGVTSIIFGELISVYGVHLLGFIAAAMGLLLWKYRRNKGLPRTQIKYLLLGLVFSLIFACITNFLIPYLTHEFAATDLGPFFMFFFVGFTAYAIIKHRLMDVRLIVARTISYAVLVVLLESIYVIVILSLSRFLSPMPLNGNQLFINAALTLVIAFSFPPLRHLIEKITDNVFFQDRYQKDTLLSELAKITSSTLILHDLINKTLEKLLSQMKIDRGGIILLENGHLKEEIWYKNSAPPPINKEQITNLMLAAKQPIIFDELEEGRKKDSLRKLNYYYCQNIQVKNKNFGLLLLGEKLSGDIYATEDLKVLTIFIPQLAVAIENALAYQKIQKFSETLKIEIDKATETLRATNEKLRNVSALKDEFVSLTSHELRTPLTAIAGSLSTVLEGFAGKVGPKTREFLAGAYNENLRLIRLVNNLLNISRIESGRLKFLPINFDLGLVIKEVIENLKTEALEKKIELLASCEAKTMVYADQDKVREILINLVGNSIKFTDKGKVVVTAWTQDGLATVQVEDSGRGILPENQQKLFKKFERVDSSEANRAKGGTGLGLYICKNLLKGMGGDIWLKSSYNLGTTFIFTIPRKQ